MHPDIVAAQAAMEAAQEAAKTDRGALHVAAQMYCAAHAVAYPDQVATYRIKRKGVVEVTIRPKAPE